jgi:hypothetical protein
LHGCDWYELGGAQIESNWLDTPTAVFFRQFHSQTQKYVSAHQQRALGDALRQGFPTFLLRYGPLTAWIFFGGPPEY